MAEGGALRQVFAELGFTVEEEPLRVAEAVLDKVIGVVDRLIEGIDDLAQEMADTRGAVAGLDENMSRLGDAMEDAGAAARETAVETDSVRDAAMSAVAAGIGPLVESISALIDRMAESADQAVVAADSLEKVAAAAEEAGDSVEDAGSKSDKTGVSLGKLAKGALMFAAAKKAFSWISGVVNETSDMISQFQMTTQEIATLRTVARDTGLSMGQIANGMKKLAGEFGGQTTDAYEQLELFAEELKGIEDPAKRAARATQLMGDAGIRMLPYLEKGAEGVREMEERTKALGGGFAGDGAKGLIAFQSAVASLTTVLESLFARILDRITPALEWFGDVLTDITGPMFEVIDNSKILETVLIALAAAATYFGVKALAAWVMATWPLILLAAKIAAVILVVEDLWQLFTGGQSVIGDLIDSLFGVGSAAKVVDFVKDAFARLMTSIKGVGRVIAPIVDRFLGTNLSSKFDVVADVDDINNAIENAELAINGSASVGHPVSAAGGGPVEVKSEQSTNINVSASMSNEELARVIAAEQRRANEANAREISEALGEVGG